MVGRQFALAVFHRLGDGVAALAISAGRRFGLAAGHVELRGLLGRQAGLVHLAVFPLLLGLFQKFGQLLLLFLLFQQLLFQIEQGLVGRVDALAVGDGGQGRSDLVFGLQILGVFQAGLELGQPLGIALFVALGPIQFWGQGQGLGGRPFRALGVAFRPLPGGLGQQFFGLGRRFPGFVDLLFEGGQHLGLGVEAFGLVELGLGAIQGVPGEFVLALPGQRQDALAAFAVRLGLGELGIDSGGGPSFFAG